LGVRLTGRDLGTEKTTRVKPMTRDEWLLQKRRESEERMDRLHAPTYDQEWGTIHPTHRDMLGRFLDRCPDEGLILDAACGTGKYWPILLERSFRIVGIDRSAGMLERAGARFPNVLVRRQDLRDLDEERAFDGIMCMDAMEYTPPEDWPGIMEAFRGSLRAGGTLYLTVELEEPDSIRRAYEEGRRMGFPVVLGEWAHEGGYHYYPEIERVRTWSALARFVTIAETEGDGYHHLIAGAK
jgi:SAM-dependent methyltransferase